MAFDQNSLIGPTTVTTATVNSAAQKTGDGGPSDGFDLHILCTNLIGNPNVLFRVTCLLADNVTWVPVAYDPLGPVNVPTERTIHFSLWPFDSTQWRLEAIPNAQPNGIGSLNSSSLSGQSFNSSSSGGSQALVYLAGLVVAKNG